MVQKLVLLYYVLAISHLRACTVCLFSHWVPRVFLFAHNNGDVDYGDITTFEYWTINGIVSSIAITFQVNGWEAHRKKEIPSILENRYWWGLLEWKFVDTKKDGKWSWSINKPINSVSFAAIRSLLFRRHDSKSSWFEDRQKQAALEVL